MRVHAAAVTPTELLWAPTWAARDGAPRPLPVIPGHEFSGEVAGLGEGVTAVAVGEAVYGMNDWFADGAQAEYCSWPGRSDVAPQAGVRRPRQQRLRRRFPPSRPGEGLFPSTPGLAAGQRVLIHGGLAAWAASQSSSPADAGPG